MGAKTILAAGAPKFILVPLIRRFNKENIEVFSGTNIRQADMLLTVHNAAAIFYFADAAVRRGDFKNLQAMLELAAARKVKYFYFISSSEVMGENFKAGEGDTPKPATLAGKRLLLAERMAAGYESLGFKVVIVRTTAIYGEGMTLNDAKNTRLIEVVANKSLAADGDFVYSEDLVFALYQLFCRNTVNLINISAGVALDNTLAGIELGWSPRYSFSEYGIKVLDCLKKSELAEKKQAQAAKKRLARKKILARAVPYIENIIGFVLMLLFAQLQNGTPVNSLLYFDLNYVYIGVMGILYGKTQSMTAFVLSSIILANALMPSNAELISILYVPQYLLHFTSYLFVAVLTGYVADHENFLLEELKWDKNELRERYNFLKDIFKDTVAIKDRFYRQIVNSEDSIGRIYRIIRRLDRIERENIFTQAAAVTADILDVDDVTLYVTSPNKAFLRQKVHLGNSNLGALSREVKAHSYLREVVEQKNIFVNRELLKDAPDLAAPIIYQDEAVAVIEIRHMDIEQWTLSQENLLSITCRLISDAIARAYRYEAEAQERKYVDGTRIMQPKEFAKIWQAMEARREVQGRLSIATVIVEKADLTMTELNERLTHAIRAEDYVGLKDGEVTILLTDVNAKTLELVKTRLAKVGLHSKVGVSAK